MGRPLGGVMPQMRATLMNEKPLVGSDTRNGRRPITSPASRPVVMEPARGRRKTACKARNPQRATSPGDAVRMSVARSALPYKGGRRRTPGDGIGVERARNLTNFADKEISP